MEMQSQRSDNTQQQPVTTPPERREGNSGDLVAKVRQANQAGREPLEKTTSIFKVIWDAIGSLISLALHHILSIALLAFGIIYINEDNCLPARLGLLLLSGGAIILIRAVLDGMISWRASRGEESVTDGIQHCLRVLSCILGIMSLVWMVVLWVNVFRIHKDVNYNKEDPNFCDETLYEFTFAVALFPFILLALLLVLYSCVGLCVIIGLLGCSACLSEA